jgi:hypothetical protein
MKLLKHRKEKRYENFFKVLLYKILDYPQHHALLLKKTYSCAKDNHLTHLRNHETHHLYENTGIQSSRKPGIYQVCIIKKYDYTVHSVLVYYNAITGKITITFTKEPRSKWQLSNKNEAIETERKKYNITNHSKIASDIYLWLTGKHMDGYILKTQFAHHVGLQYTGCMYVKKLDTAAAEVITSDIIKKEFEIMRYRELQNTIKSFLHAHGHKKTRITSAIETKATSLLIDKTVPIEADTIRITIAQHLFEEMKKRLHQRKGDNTFTLALKKAMITVRDLIFEPESSTLMRFTEQ